MRLAKPLLLTRFLLEPRPFPWFFSPGRLFFPQHPPGLPKFFLTVVADSPDVFATRNVRVVNILFYRTERRPRGTLSFFIIFPLT